MDKPLTATEILKRRQEMGEQGVEREKQYPQEHWLEPLIRRAKELIKK
jgi:hypothetical protein